MHEAPVRRRTSSMRAKLSKGPVAALFLGAANSHTLSTSFAFSASSCACSSGNARTQPSAQPIVPAAVAMHVLSLQHNHLRLQQWQCTHSAFSASDCACSSGIARTLPSAHPSVPLLPLHLRPIVPQRSLP
eukprot:1158102-Pelagomonas_calceolata.AAC.5